MTIYPRKSHLTLATSPPGLGLTLDGVPVATPHAVEGVVGFQRELAAPPDRDRRRRHGLHFTGWSDGEAIRHVIATPEADTTYTATYAPSAPFTGAYYDNQHLSGTPVLTRQDPRIDFIWGRGARTRPCLPTSSRSRWTKTQYFAAGRYRFTTVTDDGVRLYVDNKRVIDKWHGQSGTAHTYVVDLGAATTPITMEYFDEGGDALAKLTWDSTTDQPGRVLPSPSTGTPPAPGRRRPSRRPRRR